MVGADCIAATHCLLSNNNVLNNNNSNTMSNSTNRSQRDDNIDLDLDDDDDLDVVILTEDEMLLAGLKVWHYTEDMLKKGGKKLNNTRFRTEYGADPHVIAQIWEDLQTTNIVEAKLPPNRRNLQHFLMAVHFLKRYPTQYQLGNLFHVSRDTIHNHYFYYVGLIQGLKKKKIG
jgi:hypothetical protein